MSVDLFGIPYTCKIVATRFLMKTKRKTNKNGSKIKLNTHTYSLFAPYARLKMIKMIPAFNKTTSLVGTNRKLQFNYTS